MPDCIPLSNPDITEREIRAVTDVLRSGRLSIGPWLTRFEEAVAQRVGRTHAVGVSSGTAGLHLALLALGIGPGDEVITPAFSFVASANCVEYVGARPVFVDCDIRTLNASLAAIEDAITENTKAIIGVEIFGNPTGMRELAQLAQKYEIPLVEDSCEGLGGALGNDPIGRFGRVSIFGFYPNKQITTGEGGMIVTDDDRIASFCRSMRNQGRADDTIKEAAPNAEPIEDPALAHLGSWLLHERLGWNYRLDEMSAALGAVQMERLDTLVAERDRVANAYTRRLAGNTDVIVPTIDSDVRMSWFVYVVRLTDRFSAEDRDMLIDGLRRHDVGSSNYFPPIHLQPHYRRRYGYRGGEFPVAESVSQRTIALPFYPGMTENDVDLVCQTLEVMLTRMTFARD